MLMVEADVVITEVACAGTVLSVILNAPVLTEPAQKSVI
jgi:hypothetical protein